MNKILSDLINTKEVTSFIDDIIIETEKKEGHSQVCYELMLKSLSNRTTLVLSNTRELDRVPNTK